MIPEGIHTLIGKIRIVENEDELGVLLQELKPGNFTGVARVAFINAHGFNLCWKNPEFLQDVLSCDYVFRDGAGMKILFSILGRDAGLNMNGTDFIPRIIDLYKGCGVALIGTDDPYLDKARLAVLEKGLVPVLVKNGFHEAEDYATALHSTPAPLVILAMGMPKQEFVAARIAQHIRASSLVVCGGAILDFIGGKVKRAPFFLQKAGLEWLYRLVQEPRRLFSRYIFGNAAFLIRTVRLWRTPLRKEKDARLKILHVVRQYEPSVGGLESYVRSMVRHQKQLGMDCEVLTLDKLFYGNAQRLPHRDVIDGTPVRRVSFIGKRRYFFPFISPLFFKKYDLVHVHNTDMFFDYGGLCCALTGTPCVATTHGGFFHTRDLSLIKKLYFNIVTRASALCYKHIFAISRQDEDIFKRISGKVSFMPNAIEPLQGVFGNGQDFLYIGRLAHNKNPQKMIEVFAALKNTHGIAGRLHIVGPEWDVPVAALQKEAGNLDVAGDIVFHGPLERSAMGDVAAQCGYFISASGYEGFGMSMLEGMSAGLIPLVHANTAFQELIYIAKVGFLADFADPVKAATEIAAYMPSISGEDKMRAREFASSYAWLDLAEKTVGIYKDILS